LSCIINLIISRKEYISEISSLATSLFFQAKRFSSKSRFIEVNFPKKLKEFFKKNKFNFFFFYIIWLFFPNGRELKRINLTEYSVIYIPCLVLLFSGTQLSEFSLFIAQMNCLVCIIAFLFSLNLLSFAGEGFRYFGSLGFYTGSVQFVIFIDYIFKSIELSRIETFLFFVFVITIAFNMRNYFKFGSPPNKEYLFKNIAASLTLPRSGKNIAGSPMTSPFPLINEFDGISKIFFPYVLTQPFIKNFTNGYPKLRFSDQFLRDFDISLVLQDKDFDDSEFDDFLETTSFDLETLHECTKFKLINFNSSSND